MKKLTVEDVLKYPEFKDFKVISGRGGLKNEVSSITVIDAPDPFPWSKGGEIIVSSGYIFKNTEDMPGLIRKLKESGNSALFLKVNRYLGMIPEEVRRLSDEIDFPIVDVPIEKAFIEVIYPTLSLVLKSTVSRLTRSEEIHRIFTDLVIKDASTESIISVLRDVLGEELIYYSLRDQNYIFPENPKKLPWKKEEKSIYEILKEYHNWRIGVNNITIGYIIFYKAMGEEINRDEFNSLKHVNTALFLNYQKKLALLQIVDRHKNELVQDIILNNIKYTEEVAKRADSFGWKFKPPFRVVVVDIDNFKLEYLKINRTKDSDNLESLREKIFNNAIEKMRKYFKESVYASFSDSIAFIISLPEKATISFDDLIEAALIEIKESTMFKYKHSLTQGVGRVKDKILDIHESFKEAQKCIKVGRMTYVEDSINFYDRLGVFRLLFNVENKDDLKDFVEMELGKLIAYDKRYNSQYVNSLEVIDQSNWNLKEAKDKMFIHYNTMKYRYNKISEILGMDLNDREVRSNLSIALKILKINLA